MRVLIAGANGMLGHDLVDVLSHQENIEVFPFIRKELDITDMQMVMKTVNEVRPDILINAAAYTNVDLCETEIDISYQINAVGSRNLAVAANEYHTAMLHFSTDYVFPGNADSPYREFDPIQPKSIYGKSKWAGEELIRSLCPRHYIIRTSWLYGMHGKNFVSTMLHVASKQSSVRVVNDQVGSPTYTLDLAHGVAELFTKHGAYGTYHLSNSGTCSWFDFAKEIFTQRGLDTYVESMTTAELARPAPRPAYSVLDNQLWRLSGLTPLRPYQEALADYLKKLQIAEGGIS